MAAWCYLVRHGEAVASHPEGDAARGLTPTGMADVRHMAEGLKAETVTRVLASPFVRAAETAELLAEPEGLEVEVDDRLAAGASTGWALLRWLRQLGPGALLVGHNPEISEVASLLADAPMVLPAGAIVAFDREGDRFSVAWVRSPGAPTT